MAHDVPIATEEGSHNPGIFRANIFATKNGEEGLAGPTDGRVSALDVPNNQIRVSPASYTIINRESGYPREMYAGRLQTPDTVTVAPTTSSGGRTDLVVFRVENPTIGAWTALPPDKKPDGPYVFTRVIQNVPAGTTSVRDLPGNYSAITLARLVIPPSTSTITNAMISPLQGTSANPIPAAWEFTDLQTYPGNPVLPPPPGGSGTRYSSWVQWPAGATWQVPVPAGATEAQIKYEVDAVLTDNTWGELAVYFNGRTSTAVAFDVNYPLISGLTRCGFTNGGGMREQYRAGGKFAIRTDERGTTVPVTVMARTIDSSSYGARGSSRATANSLGELTVRFKQSAVAP